MAQLTLVLGGVRSGKSGFAEGIASKHPPVTYLATGLAGDEEMAERIRRHQTRRPKEWQTVECPWHLASSIEQSGGAGCLIVDCISLWLTNLMLGIPGHSALSDDEIAAAGVSLVEKAMQVAARVIVVSNEVGCGLVPPERLGRRFVDLLGETNQRLARAASDVHLCVAGLAMRLK